MITKFPVGFYFTLQDGAKKFDKQTPGAKVVFAQGKSATDDAGEIAAIQDMVDVRREGNRDRADERGGRAGAQGRSEAGVKIVLIDNDIPTWNGKSSVVATNNFNGGVLAGKYIASRLQAGRQARRSSRACPACPSLDDRVNGMLEGARRAEEPS